MEYSRTRVSWLETVDFKVFMLDYGLARNVHYHDPPVMGLNGLHAMNACRNFVEHP